MEKAIIYQMLPRLWGEGKMSSVDSETLNYLKKLGISHVWYTGIIEHSTCQPFVKGNPGSPYAISNYYNVNPYLADNEKNAIDEFKSLVKRTHEHGMKVLIDFVPNHVGRNYKDGRGEIPHFDYSDYDWTDTYKINYSHPNTWETLKGILRHWLSMGVDGFRCDMVEMVPPEFFKWVIAQIKEEFPGTLFIAEVYKKECYYQYIKEVGFDYLYDKSGMYDVLRGIAAGWGSTKSITWNWQSLGDLQPNMLNFLENHDEQRIASPWFTGEGENWAYLYSSLMLNKAAFMLYFGGEVGITAEEGHEGRTSIFNFCHPEALDRLWKYVHEGRGLRRSETGILAGYRRALALANRPCIQNGLTFDLNYCQKAENGFDFDKDYVFIRKSSNKTNKLKNEIILFFCNFSKKCTGNGTKSGKKVRVTISDHAFDYLHLERNSDLMEKGVEVDVKYGECTLVKL